MTRNRPISSTEAKILVYNKVKNKGLTYSEACAEVRKETEEMIKNSKTKKKDAPNFKQEFQKLTNGK